MSGEAFQAGSIFFQLRALSEQVTQGVQVAREQLQKIDSAATQLAQRLQTAGEKMNQGLTAPAAATGKLATGLAKVETANARLIGRISNTASRLLSIQLALSAVTQSLGDSHGGLALGLRVVSGSLQAFASMIMLIPNPLGILLGALAAVGTAYAALARETNLAKEAQERFKAGMESTEQLVRDMVNGFEEQENQFKDRRDMLIELGHFEEANQINAEHTREAYEKTLEFFIKAQAKIRELRLARNLNIGDEKKVDAIDSAIETLQQKLVELREGRDWQKSLSALFGAYDKSQREEIEEKGNEEVKKLLSARRRALGDEIRARQEVLDLVGQELNEVEKIEAMQKKALAELQRIDPKASLDLFQKEFDKLKEAARRADFHKTFAQPFGDAVGAALRDGILNAQSAMEALANFGEGLFTDMVTNLTTKLQKNLTDALTEIAGAGGEVLGNLLGSLAGVAGYFLSRGKGKSTATYGATSAITSRDVLRGVVAGPSSISIASVGENLDRALVPVLARMDIMIGFLSRISSSAKGSASAGGLSYAGTVPTS